MFKWFRSTRVSAWKARYSNDSANQSAVRRAPHQSPTRRNGETAHRHQILPTRLNDHRSAKLSPYVTESVLQNPFSVQPHQIDMAEDLSAERTPGFKVGEKKTIDEYQKLGKLCSTFTFQDFYLEGLRPPQRLQEQLAQSAVPEPCAPHQCILTRQKDQDDEALNRWKASLGLGQGESISDPNDRRLCIIKSLALVRPSRLPSLYRTNPLTIPLSHRKSKAARTSPSTYQRPVLSSLSSRNPSPSRKAAPTR